MFTCTNDKDMYKLNYLQDGLCFKDAKMAP